MHGKDIMLKIEHTNGKTEWKPSSDVEKQYEKLYDEFYSTKLDHVMP